jgi:hypothetical protein
MTEKAAPKRPDSCPRCGSENPNIYRTQRADGQWIYWESGKRTSQYSCSDPWHDTVATTSSCQPEYRKLLETVRWIAGQTDLFFAECSQAEEIVQRCKEALGVVTAEENQDDQTESSKMPVLRGERDSVSQQSPNVVVRDIPEGEIARVKKEENQDAGIHGRNSGGDVLGISGLGNSDGSVVNRRMGTGEVPATPSEHSVEIEENQDETRGNIQNGLSRGAEGHSRSEEGIRPSSVPPVSSGASDQGSEGNDSDDVAPPPTEAPQRPTHILGMEPEYVARQMVRTLFREGLPYIAQQEQCVVLMLEFNHWLVSTNETLQKLVLDKINTQLPQPILIEKDRP